MFNFKVWDQARNGGTMGIRVSKSLELQRFSAACTSPDRKRVWQNLAHYLTAASQTTTPIEPFVRVVDLLWMNNSTGIPLRTFMTSRRLRVTYSGRVRQSGGMSAQAYIIVDPQWTNALAPFNKQPLSVDYFAGGRRDLVIVY